MFGIVLVSWELTHSRNLESVRPTDSIVLHFLNSQSHLVNLVVCFVLIHSDLINEIHVEFVTFLFKCYFS